MSSELRRRDARWADLERLRASHPMMDAVIDEVNGRQDPHRRSLALRLRLLQLPGFRPSPGDHPVGRARALAMGHAPELVPVARQSSPVRRDRGAAHRPTRSTRLTGAPDNHDHSLFGDPGARRSGDGAGRLAGAQDHLRRRRDRARSRARLSTASERTTTATSRRSCVRCQPADHACSASTG